MHLRSRDCVVVVNEISEKLFRTEPYFLKKLLKGVLGQLRFFLKRTGT